MKRFLCFVMIFSMLGGSVFASDNAKMSNGEQLSVGVEQGQTVLTLSGQAENPRQEVVVRLLKPGVTALTSADDILYQKQSTTDDSGAFAFRVQISKNTPSGTVCGAVLYEDGKKSDFTFEYKSGSDIEEAFDKLKQLQNVEEAQALIEKYASEWGMDFSLYTALDANGKKEAVSSYLKFRGTDEDLAQAKASFKDAVSASAICNYSGDFDDLLTGTHAEYTGLLRNETYVKFAPRLDMKRLGERMKSQSFANGAEIQTKFSTEIALLMVEKAQSWFEVKEGVDVLAPILGLDNSTFNQNQQDIGNVLVGNVYTAESFKEVFAQETQKMQSGVRVVFDDVVSETLWANDSVNALYDMGIVSGTSDTTFEPNGNVTREQFAKMLVSMLGDNEFVAGNSFADVPETEWFAPYVSTAKEIGLVNGVSPTEFGVGQNITREQMAAMIYRAGNLLGYVPNGAPKSFTDAISISDYAVEAINALTAGGVINGMSDGSFAPSATATRAEAACMIYNMVRAVKHNPDNQTGLRILAGIHPMVSYMENFDWFTEKDYKVRDLASVPGWYFVPNGNSYISVVKAPAGKTDKVPSNGEANDMAVRIQADNSTASAFFDTEPFFLSENTYGNLHTEMNLHLSSQNTSEKYKVFNLSFMSYAVYAGSKDAPFIYFAGNGGVYYYDQNQKGVRCGSYPQNTWMHVALDMDTVKKTFTLYIDGVAIAENVPFSNPDVYWDGSDPNAEFRKIRMRVGVMPDSAGVSSAYLDDIVWAMKADAPAILLDKAQSDNSRIVLSVPENMNAESLEYITVSVNGTKIQASGTLQKDTYILTLPSALQSGDVAEVTIGKWVGTQSGVINGTPRVLTYTVQ